MLLFFLYICWKMQEVGGCECAMCCCCPCLKIHRLHLNPLNLFDGKNKSIVWHCCFSTNNAENVYAVRICCVCALFPFKAIRIFRFRLRTKSNRKVTIRLLDSIAKRSSKRMHIDFDEGNSLRWRFFLCFIHIKVNAFFCVFLVVDAQPQDT